MSVRPGEGPLGLEGSYVLQMPFVWVLWLLGVWSLESDDSLRGNQQRPEVAQKQFGECGGQDKRKGVGKEGELSLVFFFFLAFS